MADFGEVQHDITLIITTGLFILFAAGLATPIPAAPPVVVPPAPSG